MRTIVRVQFGSHLYGTNTPSSDTDLKSVFLPTSEDILLHRTKTVVQLGTKRDNSIKNTADDVDDEAFALHRFFDLLEKGETMAVEVLFAPERSIILKTPEWEAIQGVRHRLVSKTCGQMVGYMVRQAAKYGIKGGRIATTRAALDILNRTIAQDGGHQRLSYIHDLLKDFVGANEHTALIEIPQANGSNLVHWDVCDRKLPMTTTLTECQRVLTRLFENYGDRARQAETNQGIDWKAMSHAIRVGYQAIELLNTGEIVFPRPHAAHLLKIKRGKLEYAQVAEELEWLLDGVKLASETSSLPEASDRALMNNIILDFYENQVLDGPSIPVDWWPHPLAERAAA